MHSKKRPNAERKNGGVHQEYEHDNANQRRHVLRQRRFCHNSCNRKEEQCFATRQYSQLRADCRKIDNLTARLQEKFNTVGDLVRWEQQMTSDAIDDMLTLRMGLPMYLLLMERFNIKQIHVCGTGLWYGIYLQHLFNIAD